MSSASLVVVYTTVFLDLLGFGIILPLLPYYAETHGATGLGVGALMASYSAAQLVGAPLLGRLSDRLGRRPVLIGCLFGSAVSLTATGLADSLPTLIAARGLAGLFAGSIGTAQAYIADVTPPANRAKAMGLLGASIGLGFVFGPAVGAGLSRWGFATAAFVAAGLAGANGLFAIFALKESLPSDPAERAALRTAGAKRVSHWRKPSTRRLLIAVFASTTAFVALEATFALLGEHRFGLYEREMGFVFTYLGVIIIFVQGGAVGPLTRRMGEAGIARVGAVTMAVAFLGVGLAPDLWVVILALGVLSAGQGLLRPGLTALVSFEADAGGQGELLGLAQGTAAAARATGPILAGWLYDVRMEAPYLLGAALAAATAALLMSARVSASAPKRV